MNIYEHRNGESEIPEIQGKYWFQGINTAISAWDSDHKIQELVFVSLEPRHDIWVPVQLTDDSCYYYAEPSDLIGQWWGPVLAPWD